MKKLFLLAFIAISVIGCKSGIKSDDQDFILAELDLVNIDNDRVQVTIDPGKLSGEEATFYIPKTVPGTYALNSYGQFSEDLIAYDYDGEPLEVERKDEDTWVIQNAEELDKVTYYVNDTFDVEGEGDVFSPAGTNIAENENFVLNLHAFVGYFEGMKETPYKLEISRPTDLEPSASLEVVNQTNEEAYVVDEFYTDRYFGVIDHPIMYSDSEIAIFDVGDMKVLLNVYSPNNAHSTKDLTPAVEKMVQAQKSFLGDIDNTDIYAILVYLSDMENVDARGFGALEHHTSTVVVLPETMPIDQLEQSMTDIVSHEFFHILTPLNVHSEEVHYFDYNDPKMSKHLWMYEGVTEYFANLFQINQDLISEEEFYNRLNEKIESSMSFDDTMSFTEMSKNILDDKYSPSYYNVYQKGALIGMALDLELRMLSDGEMGVLDLMKMLIEEYGVDHPFKDDELFEVITEKTYPEIGKFFETYVAGNTPIPYDKYFGKVGIEKETKMVKSGYFLDGQTPLIDANQQTKEIFFRKDISVNSVFDKMGAKPGDVIKKVNGTAYNLDNVYGLISASMSWEEGKEIEMLIERDGEEIKLKGETTQPMLEKSFLKAQDLDANSKEMKLRNAWLKG
ncbi:MAG: peptidase M61 [Bacteroidota bacterium]